MTLIVAAAIERDGIIWTLPKPARHHHIIAAMNDVDGNTGPMLKAHGKQGFVDNLGRFYNRETAAAIAKAHGQLKNPLIAPPNLFTEDLW